MARPPSVFVRSSSGDEAVRLRRLARHSPVFAIRQRAQILLASDAAQSATQIAGVSRTDENQVRRVIAELNADGMGSLRPPTGGGHPRRIDDAACEAIRSVALARPGDLGEPGTRWSLATLRRYLIRADVLWGTLEDRSVNAAVVLELLQSIRRRYPPEVQLSIVMDGLFAHWTKDIRDWAVASGVGLVPTPTNASHLNRIECHFWAYVEFVVNGSDHPDWDRFASASDAYIDRRDLDHHDPRIRAIEQRRKFA